MRENIKSLAIEPKCIVTQVGGNDLASSDTSVETVTAEYAVLLSDIKTKFPESEVVVSGLPPRFHGENIREKVKDFNNNSKKWCAANNMKYIDNEPMFELRNGEIDTSVYVTTGETPNVHLTRRGTIRILENLKKEMLNLKLNNDLNTRAMKESHPEERQTRPSFSQVVRYGSTRSTAKAPAKNNSPANRWSYPRSQNYSRRDARDRKGCFNCGEQNHVQSQCRAERDLRCRSCYAFGHKEKFCESVSY